MTAPTPAAVAVFVSQSPWSDVAAWATALGTIALAAFAFVQVRASRNETRKLEARLKAETARAEAEIAKAEASAKDEKAKAEAAAERSQAEQVVAWSWWITAKDAPYISDPGVPPVMGSARVRGAHIRNDNPTPIFNVEISWCAPDAPPGVSLELRLIPLIPPYDTALYRRPASLAEADWPIHMVARSRSPTAAASAGVETVEARYRRSCSS